ncbi:MAG: response regulator transcription factor [Bacteroidales bacterium]|jgi:DNA-binding NarL/FixJ family response regulator|nr:response regulator transcription factor [Bacteroidales bacterium]
MINIGICSDNRLMLNGLDLILSGVDDFEVMFSVDNNETLLHKVGLKNIHVLLLDISDVSVRTLNFIVRLNVIHPKLKILLLIQDASQNVVFKLVKSNAKGLLSKDANPHDLIEAVYSLRNGFDYFNKSIKRLLLSQYVSDMNSEKQNKVSGIQKLSERQVEILKLWGVNLSNQEIADELCISIRTVETHKNHIMQKLELKTTIDLVKFSIKNNIISL